MDFEKEYKDMVQRARELYESGNALTRKQMEIVCPELAESEDERIRRKMVEHFKSKTKETWCNMPVKDIIAYLEKQKEKPFTGIYWHAIKKGDTLPCRAYLWTANYEKYHDCFEGRLIPNMENVTVGADMWYLPVDDIRALPREGIDELPKEQKPEVFKIPATLCVGMPKTPPAYKLDVKPAEWSEEDEKYLNLVINIVASDFGEDSPTVSWLKSLRPKLKKDWSIEDAVAMKDIQMIISVSGRSEKNKRDLCAWVAEHCNAYPIPEKLRPHWKPSEEQMRALENCVYGWQDSADGVLKSLYNDLKKLL